MKEELLPLAANRDMHNSIVRPLSPDFSALKKELDAIQSATLALR